MSEQTQAGGVPQGIATPPQSGAGQAATPAAPGAAGQQAGSDWSASPEFREFQRKFDAREAALKQQLADMQAQLAAQTQAEAQRKQAEFDALAPEEQVRILKAREQQAEALRQQEEAQKSISLRALSIVQAAGLSWDDPRLQAAKNHGPSQAGLDAITQAVIEISRQERETLAAAGKSLAAGGAAAAAANADAAAVNALNQAGVTRVPLSGGGSVIGNTDADPRVTALRDQFEKNVRGKGVDSREYRDWVDAVLGAGLPLDAVH